MSLFSSTSAPRRLTNVLLPSWRTSGKAASARSKDSFSAAIARANVLPLATSAERSSRRSAIALVARAPCTTKSVKVFWSRPSSCITRVKLPSDGPRYLKVSLEVLALADVPARESLERLLQSLAGLRIERVEQLVEVDRVRRLVGPEDAALVDLGRVVRARGAARCSGWRPRAERTRARWPPFPRAGERSPRP